MRRFLRAVLPTLALLLAGCAGDPPGHYATAASVLQAQYDAGGTHGAMRGPEAGAILATYARRIAAPPADPASAAGFHP